jgi:ssDNA-specific exonuclease RecJ
MAIFNEDHSYVRGKKALEELKIFEAEDIRHYVSEIIKFSNNKDETIKEMTSVFEGIKRFINI